MLLNDSNSTWSFFNLISNRLAFFALSLSFFSYEYHWVLCFIVQIFRNFSVFAHEQKSVALQLKK